MSTIIEKDYSIGDVISLLWFKRSLPRYCTKFIEVQIFLGRRFSLVRPLVCSYFFSIHDVFKIVGRPYYLLKKLYIVFLNNFEALSNMVCVALQMCIMMCADHGPAVSGAHNTIVTARAGKDLVSSLVSGT